MDNPEMDLLSLPDEFKLQIFKKLNWNILKNVKLVCKNFYLLIEKNIQSLDRPKANSVSICYKEDKISRVDYSLIVTEDTFLREPTKRVDFGNDDNYEKFLKNIDFTEIKHLCLRNHSSKEFISVRYYCKFGSDFSTYNFSAKLPNGRYCRKYISFRIRNSKKFGILYDCTILSKESLRKLGLFERCGPYFVGKKIVMDLLTGNSMLEYENIPINTHKLLYAQIMDHLNELRFFSLENTCNHKRFKLFFHKTSKFEVFWKNFYREFFDQIRFNNKVVEINNHNVCSLKSSSIKCSICGIKHEYSIVYEKNSKTLCIQLL
uniref:F-box domain-containing protein n=1 Tax=Strongyloides venezuelensis TaxID=75913 RepID=A0A0K0FGR1_STRVS